MMWWGSWEDLSAPMNADLARLASARAAARRGPLADGQGEALLMGGVHKANPEDGTRLRGDINACLVDDLSTAKSEFLTYICSILPRAVYAI